MKNSPKSIKSFLAIFKLVLCCLFYLLAMDLFYRFNSFTYYMSRAEIWLATANMAIVLFFISVLAAFLIFIIQAVLGFIFGRFLNGKFILLRYTSDYLIAVLFIYLNTMLIYFLLFKDRVEGAGLLIKAVALLSIFAALVLLFISFRKKIRFFLAENINLYFSLCCAVIFVSLGLAPYLVHKLNASKAEGDVRQNALKIADRPGYPRIILITFDALNARHMSLYGYPRKTTPNIEDFSKDCLVFNNMYSNGNTTMPSVVSILTGKYPSTHKAYSLQYIQFSPYNNLELPHHQHIPPTPNTSNW